MNQLECNARITWTDELIVVESQPPGQSPRRSELAWSSIEAWSVGPCDGRYPEGVYLLISRAPHYQHLPVLVAGSVALQGELRARGLPELTADEVIAEAHRRR